MIVPLKTKIQVFICLSIYLFIYVLINLCICLVLICLLKNLMHKHKVKETGFSFSIHWSRVDSQKITFSIKSIGAMSSAIKWLPLKGMVSTKMNAPPTPVFLRFITFSHPCSRWEK